jgi:hypothetical protein
MSDSALRLERGTAVAGRSLQAVALCLAIACMLVVAARGSQPAPAGRFECGSDPWDFLRLGELLEPSSLAFLVEAHCANAKHMRDDRIELRYDGSRVEVELRRVHIADTTYLRIASIGGVAAP